MSGDSTLSVVITAHNRREYLPRAIASVTRQEYYRRDIDVVVLTDFEVPESPKLRGGGEVRYFLDPSRTVGETIVRAADLAAGELLVFLDDDDVFALDKLSRAEAILDQFPLLSYYHNNFATFSGSSLPLASADVQRAPAASLRSESRKGSYFDQGNSAELLRFLAKANHEQNMSSSMVRKRIVLRNRSLLRRIEGLQDTFLLFCALLDRGPLFFDSSTLTWVRRHPGNSSKAVEDVSRRIRAWGIIGELIKTGEPDAVASSYFAIRHSRATIYERVLGGTYSEPDVRSAMRSVLDAASVSGARNTFLYSLLGLVALDVLPVARLFKPFLIR